MLARFFIDRPVLAWVISIVIVLLGAIAAGFLPVAEYPEITPPTVRVTGTYPGANAKVVADTVAAPIEQQVVGVEQMLYMSSQSNNDGSYTLDVTFELGTNVNIAQVLVQNRVAIAEPTLPDVVRTIGVITKKRSPDILLGISLYSEDNPETGKPYYDALYMSNYATINLKDAISRVEGVGDVLSSTPDNPRHIPGLIPPIRQWAPRSPRRRNRRHSWRRPSSFVLLQQPLFCSLKQQQFVGDTPDVVLTLHLDLFWVVVLIVLVVQAGIERLRPPRLLKILGKLPLLEDRLDLGDKRWKFRPKFGVLICGVQVVQELLADEVLHGINGAELVLDSSRCFALLDPDFVKVQHGSSSKCSSQ